MTTSYIIMLVHTPVGNPLEWITDWLSEWGDDVAITTGTTDKQERDVIVLEFFGEDPEDVPDARFYQRLKEDPDISDFLVHISTEEEEEE